VPIGRGRLAGAGPDAAGSPVRRPGVWEVPVGLLVVIYAFAFLTLPAFEEMTNQWAVDSGWLTE
jgi:hypothetical protein